MENDIEKSNVPNDPILITDECGHSMWDAVLEQFPFLQALRQATKKEPDNKKDKQ